MFDRREALSLLGGAAAGAAIGLPQAAPAQTPLSPAVDRLRGWSSTPDAQWQNIEGLAAAGPETLRRIPDVILGEPAQTVTGFGGAFSELGWVALQALAPRQRELALHDLFGAEGLNLGQCRTPIGANDIARRWYSYDETDGDFALKDFSIANDLETLVPFIAGAQAVKPDLALWASPWSPPTWMKTGRHYAQAPAMPGQPSNGIRPDQMGKEGTDSFIQQDRYFDAYARYFRRYVESYAARGIRIGTVMPQNEFNSAQPFPSCCWTPQGLARFMPFLGREMDKVGAEIFLGTLERGNADLVSQVLSAPGAMPHIKGVGVQWAGKGAIEVIRSRHPSLAIWGSEQECGDGRNDWRFARYGWSLMRRYFNAGASLWDYWNMVMATPGVSTWGWAQNSLISVDTAKGSYRLNPDYWVMKHLASQVRPGARLVSTISLAGFENQLVFRNPDGALVIVIHNEMPEPLSLTMLLGSKVLSPTLPPSSFSTIVLPGSAG